MPPILGTHNPQANTNIGGMELAKMFVGSALRSHSHDSATAGATRHEQHLSAQQHRWIETLSNTQADYWNRVNALEQLKGSGNQFTEEIIGALQKLSEASRAPSERLWAIKELASLATHSPTAVGVIMSALDDATIRADVALELAELGPAATVFWDKLTRLAEVESDPIKHNCLQIAIERTESPNQRRARLLVTELKSSGPEMREAIVKEIADIGPDANGAGPYLLSLLQRSAGERGESHEARALIRALGKIRASEASEELLKRMADGSSTALEALEQIVGTHGASTIEGKLIAGLGQGGSPHYISGVARLLGVGQTKSINAIPNLLSLVDRHFSSEVRTAAAFAIGEMAKGAAKKEAVETTLIRALSDEYNSVREATLYSLGKLKAMSAAPCISELLRDPYIEFKVEVGSAAAWALGEIGDRSAAPELMALNNTTLRIPAGVALAKMGFSHGIKMLQASPRDRDYYCEGTKGAPVVYQSLEFLWNLARVVEALGSTRNVLAVPALLRVQSIASKPLSPYLPDEVYQNIQSAARAVPQALAEIKSSTSASEIATLLHYRPLMKHTGPGVRQWAAEALGEKGDKAAIAPLHKRLRPFFLGGEWHGGVRRSLDRALARLEGRQPSNQERR